MGLIDPDCTFLGVITICSYETIRINKFEGTWGLATDICTYKKPVYGYFEV